MASANPVASTSPRRWLRAVWSVAAGLVVIVALALVVLHTQTVRGIVLSKLAARLHSDLSIDLRASELRYNLLTFAVTLHDASVAAIGTPDAPFFTAEAVTADFAARTLLGTVDLQRLDIRSPRIVIRRQDDVSNLPAFTSSAGAAGNLRLPRLNIADLEVSVAISNRRLDLQGVHVEISPVNPGRAIEGRIEARRGVAIDLEGATHNFERAVAELSFATRTLTIERLIVSGGPLMLRGRGTIETAGTDPQINLELSGTADLATWDAGRRLSHVAGVVNLSAHLTGPLLGPAVTFAAAGRDVAWSRYRASTVTLRGVWRDGSIEAHTDARSGNQSVSVAVSASAAADQWRIGVTASSPTAWNGNGSARIAAGGLTLDAMLSGRLDALNGNASFAFGTVRIRGKDIGPLQGRLTLNRGVAILYAAASSRGASMNARLVTRAPYAFSGGGVLRSVELSRLFSVAGVAMDEKNLAGTLDARLRFHGDLTHPADMSATLEAMLADASVYGVPIRASAPLRMKLADDRLQLEEAALAIGDIAVRATADFGIVRTRGAATLDIDGDLASLSPVLARFSSEHPWSASGRIAGALQMRRSAAGLSVTGNLLSTSAELRRGESAIVRDARLSIDLTGSRALVRELRGEMSAGHARVSADLPLAWANEWLPRGWRFSGRGANAPAAIEGQAALSWHALNAAGEKADAKEAGATVGLTAHLTAAQPKLNAVAGEIRMEHGRIATRAEQLVQTEPAIARFRRGALTIDRLHWQGAGNEITAHGVLGLANGIATDLRIELGANLSLIDAIAHQGMSGHLSGNVAVTGRRDALRVTGNAAVADVGWLLPRARLYLSGWSGRMSVAADALVIDELAGQVNGGPVRIDGRIPLGDRAALGKLTIAAHDIVLDMPEGLHSQLSAALTWQPVDDVPTLAGTVTVTTNRYTEPITQVLELVDRIAPTGLEESAAAGMPEWLTATRLDVDIEVTDPIVVDNSIGSVELVPDLRLLGTLGEPALLGSVAALDGGTIRIGGRAYHLRESSLRFSPAEGLMPTFDASGETRIGDYDVSLRITGAPGRIETSYRSSPPLSERDLKSLIVTGQTESAAHNQLQSGRGQSSDEFALAAVSTDILGFAGKFVGLDSVSFGTADLDLVSKDLDSAQHVTVSKAFGRKLQLIVSDNLETGALTWVVAWKPVPDYELRVASVEDTEHTIELRRQMFFGPGGHKTATTAAQAKAPNRIVSAVTFVGTPGFDERELRRVLKLAAGAPFDVRRWTEDRLRLERLYQKRGYQRARITPTRAEVGAADGARTISLHYQIVRGPRTVIETSGDRLPRSATEAMGHVWRGVPVKEIVVEGLSRIARQKLAMRGYFQSQVQVELASDTTDLAKAVIDVVRGPRTQRRHIDWQGNSVVTDADLETLAGNQTGVSSVWVEPAALVRAIRGRYAQLGYLATKVDVGMPGFEKNSAILPIEIHEGPQSVVAQVELAGVHESRRAAALAALELPVGAALGSSSLREARQRLMRYYANLGYRNAKVDCAAVPGGDPGAVVRTTVQEGALQVIEAVRVTGVESTVRSLVDRSLALQPGEYAAQEAADTTQRNLYAIGSFRQVEIGFQPTGSVVADGRQSVLALIRTEEPQRYQLRYGLQVSNGSDFGGVGEDAVSYGGTADFRDRNFLGRALEASAGVEWEPDLQALTLALASPRTLGRPIRTNVYARTRDERDEVATGVDLLTRERDFTVEQRWQIRPAVELTWGYTYGYDRYRLEGGDTRADFEGYLAGPTVSLVVDHRDNAFDARRGWYHSSNLQVGMPALGSDLGYYRVLLRQTQLIRAGPVSFAASARLGTVHGYSGYAPLSAIGLLFTAGGTNSVRGYSEGSLSAFNVGDVSIGGPELLVLNGEARFPVYGLVSGVAFIDAGNTFRDFDEISLGDLAIGAGLGVRIRTPLAPLRLDFGYPLSSGFGSRELHIHFSIGQMF